MVCVVFGSWRYYSLFRSEALHVQLCVDDHILRKYSVPLRLTYLAIQIHSSCGKKEGAVIESMTGGTTNVSLGSVSLHHILHAILGKYAPV